MNKKNVFILIALILITQIAGLVWVPFTDTSSNWYLNLETPSFNPPSWIFGPVWTILYLLMAISIYLVYKSKKIDITTKKRLYSLYSTQLFFNFLWTPTFFILHSLWASFIVILILLIFLLIIAKKYLKYSKKSFYLWISYIFWVSFATILNLGFLILN